MPVIHLFFTRILRIFAAAFLRQQTWQGKPEVKPLQQNKS
jgi:hypothetical protein